MGTPAKRRKLNDSSKSSPAASRNLDFFFGKQEHNLSPRPTNGDQSVETSNVQPEFTDEELARRLQAEWDQEAGGQEIEASTSGTVSNPVKDETIDGDPNEGIDGTAVQSYANEEVSSHVENESHPIQKKGRNTLSLQSAASEEDTIISSIPFDESPLTFCPSQYASGLQKLWAAEGGKASYALLTRCFVLVNSTQSRIKIVDTLVNFLRTIIEGDPTSLLPTVRTNYCFCQIFVHLVLSASSTNWFEYPPFQLLYMLCHSRVLLASCNEADTFRFGSQPTQYPLHMFHSSLVLEVPLFPKH